MPEKQHEKNPPRKGTFGRLRLPVARAYLRPLSRRRLLGIGAIAFAAILAVAAIDLLARGGKLLSNGPLSSQHALQEGECGACHLEFGQVSDAGCTACHETAGDRLGLYSFATHYLYRSSDFERAGAAEHELPCASCHREHLGRAAEITRVPDSRCLDCHDYGSFGSSHPEFAFARETTQDDDALHFPHVTHVREVMARAELEDTESSCLYCHRPQADGKAFRPIDFDRHCDSCHLTPTTATARLPIRQTGDNGTSAVIGVDNLETVRAGGGAGTQWVFESNPNEFRTGGPWVMKSPLSHQDPWILYNLRQLRQTLYPRAGLADLLRASPATSAQQLPDAYREAIATLEQHARGLRNRPEPEIQRELATIGELLARAQRAVPSDGNEVAGSGLALEEGGSTLSSEQVTETLEVVAALTTPCRQCHLVERATIRRIEADRRTLRNAEFNHRAHTLQRGCLDCHAEIPIAELVGSSDSVDPAVDSSGIHNLPKKAVCEQCHEPQRASQSCVTCHLFHPDKDRTTELAFHLEAD